MPLTLDEARAKVNEHVGPYEEVRDPVRTTTFGWVFTIRPKPGEQIIGGWDLIGVEADGGRLIEHGSCATAHWFDDDEEAKQYHVDLLDAWERGYRYGRYDITMSEVRDIEATAELGRRLGLEYVVPDEHEGTVWRIPRHYSIRFLRSMLADAPITFTGQYVGDVMLRDAVDHALATKCCHIAVTPVEIGQHRYRGVGPAPEGAWPATS